MAVVERMEVGQGSEIGLILRALEYITQIPIFNR